MGEFELIRNYFAAAPCAQGGEGVALGIGDDCACWLPAGEQLAISTDTLVAGVHFADPCDPFLLGQRSLAVAVSDLAPWAPTLAFTLALTLPTVDADWLQRYAQGLNAWRKAAAWLGGRRHHAWALSLTMTVFGRVPAGQALTRGAAGDLLCVGGELGNAAGLCRWYWGNALPTRHRPSAAGPLLVAAAATALGLALRARPLRRWIFPMGFWPIAGISPRHRLSAC
jgi:thiamine-monophosphate kinase